MAYSKQTWVRGEKVASAKLNHMEDGIATISANGAIDTANLANASVTNNKLDQEAVDSNNIRTGAIITPLIYDGAVTMPKLGADVIAELDNKADIDGSYESMTVGNAEQLISSVGIEDSTPYNFRTSGGSTEIGDREELNAVVGVSVPWNQMIENGNFESTNKWRVYTPANGQLSASENVLTITYSVASTGGGYTFGLTYTGGLQIQTGHKYMLKADVNPDFDSQFAFELGTSIEKLFSVSTNSWTELSVVAMRPSWSNANTFIIKPQHASIAVGSTLKVRNVQLIDLTLLLGSTIADYIYALNQATAGYGVAYFKKLFPKPYYAYNSGELLSVRTNLHKMVGFNQWDEVWEVGKLDVSTGQNESSSSNIRSKNYISIIPNTSYYWRATVNNGVCFYDGDKNYISNAWMNANTVFATPSNAYYMRFFTGTAYGTTYNHDICINLSWDGERDGEYEPYEAHEYALDDITLRGILKLDASNNLYADGDRYLPDGTVTRRYGVVTVNGSENWNKSGTYDGNYYCYSIVPNCEASEMNIVSTYGDVIANASELASHDRAILIDGSGYSKNLNIKNASISTLEAFKSWLTSNPVTIVYELATPTTETADPYQQTQIVDDFGTEEFIDAAVEANERDVAVPVGNVTFYPQNLRKKIEGLPFDFSTLIARTEKAFKATKAYAVNEFLTINNQLYKVRTSIANGATITVGTNVTATTIGAELTAILNS